MDIRSGLMDHQVLQRNRKDVSETTITGTTNTPGKLQAHVSKNGKTLRGLNWKTIARVKTGPFTAKLAGIPVGGPYQISLRIQPSKGSPAEPFQAKDILVGDVWILGGQSNMEGYGKLTGSAKPHPEIRAFYMDDRWAVAKDPIHNRGQAVDPIHADPNGTFTGTGPGVAFGQTMYTLSGVPQAIIPCAHGGTSMVQWDPALKNLGGKSLYGATLRRFCITGANVAGIVWYQGCAEANPPERLSMSAEGLKYTQRMKKLVAAFRKDMSNPNLPFVMAQLASVYINTTSFPELNRNWNSIQDQQRKLPTLIKNLTTVPTIDLELEDGIHLTGPEQNRLGRRLAQAAWSLMKKPNAGKPPIALKSTKTPFPNNPGVIEVTFENVEGKLVSRGRPTGFNILIPGDIEIPTAFRIELKGNKAILYTGMGPNTEDVYLRVCYGFGLNAYCNITDQADRSLPVFGPQIYFQNPNPQKSINTLRVSNYFPGAGKLHRVKCPDTSDPSLGFRTIHFMDSFANLHHDLQHKTNDALVFFAAKFQCDEPMKLDIGCGYDGPIKMWIDQKQLYHDPSGTNPMIPDQHRIPFLAQTGKHEIVVALSANCGQAWGISLRLFRKDLRLTRHQDIQSVKLPVILE